jgi:hypothetical protein
MMPSGDVISSEGKCAGDFAVLCANAPTELDFVLTRGDILAGKVTFPSYLPYRSPDEKSKDRQFSFNIKSPSFNKSYHSYHAKKGGHFRIWVPKGA